MNPSSRCDLTSHDHVLRFAHETPDASHQFSFTFTFSFSGRLKEQLDVSLLQFVQSVASAARVCPENTVNLVKLSCF